ncbi:MAG: endolytic transglycosylase MltG [Solirubrobacteraceae bacterium]
MSDEPDDVVELRAGDPSGPGVPGDPGGPGGPRDSGGPRGGGAGYGGDSARARRPTARRRHPPARYRRRRVTLLLALVVVAFAAWFAIELFQPFAGPGTGVVTVVIPAGANASQIGDELAARGVVSSSFFFSLRARLDGDGPKLRHGVVTLRHGMSYAAALSVLTTAPAVTQLEVRIPEGLTRRQIAAIAAADRLGGSYLIASRPANAGLDPRDYGAPASVHTLEGFLFPATYFSFAHENVAHLVAQQVAAFHQNFDQLSFARATASHLTRYDVLIIASMIEREAQVPSDRPLVAAVIYNRLAAGMTLGIDATLRYALNDYDKPLTASQLALDTPYNTRLHRGLPPTPISNPGLASMVAATHPAAVPYLYYVDKPNSCGELAFATSYAQFEADVAAYNAARNAAGGRAPTKCP